MNQFTISKVSNRGTDHPVVARLVTQIFDLLQWAVLEEKQKHAIMSTLLENLQKRLGQCWDIAEKIKVEENVLVANFVKTDGRIQNIPHIELLDSLSETFLYEAKNFLRDLMNGVIKSFYPEISFNDAKSFYAAYNKEESKIIKWFRGKFGEIDPITHMLKNNEGWIEEVSRKRDSIEHPGGYSGTFTIRNFSLTNDNLLCRPVWGRKPDSLSFVTDDMDICRKNLLEFTEELIIFGCIEKI